MAYIRDWHKPVLAVCDTETYAITLPALALPLSWGCRDETTRTLLLGRNCPLALMRKTLLKQ